MSLLEIEVETPLEKFRRFLIISTCRSFIPQEYMTNPNVFPERLGDRGVIYVEASDKATLKRIKDITFVRVRDVLGVIYESKSGNTNLKWRQVRGRVGKVTGTASANSLANLIAAGVLTETDLVRIAQKDQGAGAGKGGKTPQSGENR